MMMVMVVSPHHYRKRKSSKCVCVCVCVFYTGDIYTYCFGPVTYFFLNFYVFLIFFFQTIVVAVYFDVTVQMVLRVLIANSLKYQPRQVQHPRHRQRMSHPLEQQHHCMQLEWYWVAGTFLPSLFHLRSSATIEQYRKELDREFSRMGNNYIHTYIHTYRQTEMHITSLRYDTRNIHRTHTRNPSRVKNRKFKI